MVAAAPVAFGVDVDWSVSCGVELVKEAALGWAPACVEFRSGTVGEDRVGADFVLETPSSRLLIDAKFRRKDYRPYSDDVALESWSNVERGIVGWTRSMEAKTDLIVWVWQDTGRTLSLPFRPLRECMVAKWNEWCHIYRTERQVSENGRDYWTSECVFVPLGVLRQVMRPAMRNRMGVSLDGCEPVDMRFCRQPNCPQTAMYPCRPEAPRWCCRHFEESRNVVKLEHGSAPAIREIRRAAPAAPRPTLNPKLVLVDGGQEQLF